MAKYELPPLPYGKDALSPVISPETIDYHYGKHHQAYVNNLNNIVPGTKYESMSLEDVVKATNGQASEKKVFNNAAQVWNHTFYWHCLAPKAGGASICSATSSATHEGSICASSSRWICQRPCASTCMPSITWARVKTSAPARIRSATLRPSRAPSTMKSEMIAIASGWLSLTPRASRRRATIAAIEIRSLSFSRGERFMRTLWCWEDSFV